MMVLSLKEILGICINQSPGRKANPASSGTACTKLNKYSGDSKLGHDANLTISAAAAEDLTPCKSVPRRASSWKQTE